MKNNDDTKFEDVMEKLEEIVRRLEEDQVDLDEAIDLYKDGLKLSKWCEEKLNSAEKQITSILTEDGSEPFAEVHEESKA